MAHRRRSILVLALTLAWPTAAEEAPATSVSTVADLAWITGDWRGSKGDGVVEERWSEEGGGAMMGTFRWLVGGGVRLYEFMLIEPGPEGPVLRLKHFSPGLAGWEEKERSLEFHLKSVQEGRAVFEMDPEIEKARLVYETSAEGRQLKIELLKTKDDGSQTATVFEFRRR